MQVKMVDLHLDRVRLLEVQIRTEAITFLAEVQEVALGLESETEILVSERPFVVKPMTTVSTLWTLDSDPRIFCEMCIW